MRRRSGASLVGVALFCMGAASLLAWLLLSLAWSHESLAAASRRSAARASLLSQVEVCRRWVRAQLASGALPRVGSGRVTGAPDSRRVFETRGADGAVAAVYDLEPPPVLPGGGGRFLPSCPGGLLIRAEIRAGSLPSFVLETVWVTRDILLPDGSSAAVLDEHPLIWRESWP